MYKKQSLQNARMHDMPYTYQPCPQSRRGIEHRRIQLNPPTPRQPPSTPPNHLISMLTLRLHTVIQQNNVELLKSTIKLLQKSIESNLDFVRYDCSAFDAAWKTASDILATHTSMSSIIPDSPPLSTTSRQFQTS